MVRFRPSDSVFDNDRVLSEDYVPNKIRGRDDEIESYMQALQPIVDGRRTKSIFLYGKSGVGKTVITKILCTDLIDDVKRFRDIDIEIIWVMCENINTSYQGAVAITNSVLDDDDKMNETGYSAERVYKNMYTTLESVADHVIIVLDEVDNLSDDKLLYELPRANSNNRVTDVEITVIGISNDLEFKDNLRPKVRSSLAQKELFFPPYNASELQSILSSRVELAFFEDSISDSVVPLVSAYAAQNNGDARQALDLLSEAGDIAIERGDSIVQEKHVRLAQDRLQYDFVKNSISKLTTQEQCVLLALLKVDKKHDVDEIKSKDVYNMYTTIASEIDLNIVTERWVREHLDTLINHRIVSYETKNKGRSEGRFKIYSISDNLNIPNILESFDKRFKNVI